MANFAGLVLFVFIGMVNAMGTDRSAAYAIEQSVLPSLVKESHRTWVFLKPFSSGMQHWHFSNMPSFVHLFLFLLSTGCDGKPHS
jgi:hypothetical protein